MKFHIDHVLKFQYTQPVFLEPLTVRLRPRSDCSQRLLDHTLQLNPQPQDTAESLDLEGTSLVTAWFHDKQTALTLRARSEVETLVNNPFDFLVKDERYFHLPITWPQEQRLLLAPYLHRAAPDAAVDAFAREISEEVQGNTSVFLTHLAARISNRFDLENRETGGPRTPTQVLADRKGPCRDLTVLYLDACRAQGLPGRFTSGYWYHEEPQEDPELHAWAEVYLPGAGWRGYDPSAGLAVADRHVALASGPIPEWAAPTQGNFRGTGAVSRLDYKITLQTLPGPGETITQPQARA